MATIGIGGPWKSAHPKLSSAPTVRVNLSLRLTDSYALVGRLNYESTQMPTPILSVLNMKGGVGKTTVSAHVMRVLYHRMQKRVLLIDLDAQFNLTQSVMTQETYDALDETKTVMSCFEALPSNDFFQVRRSDNPPPKACEISYRLRRIGKGDAARLDLLPGSFELMKYSMIDDSKQLSHASAHLKALSFTSAI